MTTAKLTDGFVASFDSRGAEVIVWDETLKRLAVRFSRKGGKFYFIQYRPKGEGARTRSARRMAIGEHDGALWNVTKARAQARKLLALVDLGEDPFATRQAETKARLAAELAAKAAAEAEARAAEARKSETFNALLDIYVARRLSVRKSKGEAERLLRTDPAAKWGALHISEIHKKEIRTLLEDIATRAPAVASATYGELGPFFTWCVDRDLIHETPLAGVRRPPKPTARSRFLSDDELRLIWTAADRRGFPFGHIYKLLILTGQRRGEVAGMTWDELDLEAGIWRIPAARVKNSQAHELDLPADAVAILKEVRGLRLNDEHVFPKRGGEGPATGFSAAKRALDAEIEAIRREEAVEAGEKAPDKPLAEWVTHDLRRTAATGMAGLGVAPHVVERVLNHITNTKAGLVGVYQRHEYRDQRKAAIHAWGDQVAAARGRGPAGSNVIRLRV